MATTRVVTISATYGAGGTFIAPAVAERLGIPFADRLIPMQGVDPTSGEAVTSAELATEPRGAFARSLAALSAGWVIPGPTDTNDLPERVRGEVESSIQRLIDDGGAVILGRAAAVVLEGKPHAFHVRLDGPRDRRARRGSQWEQIDVATAEQHLKASDAARARYVKHLYRRDPADPTLYHLQLDPTVLPIDVCTDIVATAAEAFWAGEAAIDS
jgi:cytidylate kinase